MPANLTMQYHKAEARYKAATTTEEKIEALEEMISVIPKHKGTDKLQGDLKKRLSKLKANEGKKKGGSGRVNPYKIDRGGAGIATMIGPPNSGKSAILNALTNAAPEVAPYAFTTRIPQPGMMSFENAKITLVDTPPISADYKDPDLPGFLRKSDIVLLVLDPIDPDLLDLFDAVSNSLADSKVILAKDPKPPEPGQPTEVQTIVIFTKMDLDGAEETVETFKELYPEFYYLCLSVESGQGMEAFAKEVFCALNVVRAYTKKPGKEPEYTQPVYLKKGQTILDFARDVHKDFAENLKFARIWGEGKYDGQNVDRQHEVNDGDVIELHI